MNVAGHLAVAYLLARRRRRAWLARLEAIALGALLPDLVDKTLMLIGLTPYGRTVGHSLVFWLFATWLWMLAMARRLPRAGWLALVMVGGLSHLVVDLVDDVVEGVEHSGYVFSAWFGWPWTNPDMWSPKVEHLFPAWPYATSSLELLTLIAVVTIARRDGRAPAMSRSGDVV